jgi:hypothetical protein
MDSLLVANYLENITDLSKEIKELLGGAFQSF